MNEPENEKFFVETQKTSPNKNLGFFPPPIYKNMEWKIHARIGNGIKNPSNL